MRAPLTAERPALRVGPAAERRARSSQDVSTAVAGTSCGEGNRCQIRNPTSMRPVLASLAQRVIPLA
jgi:hypothetical protein